MTYPHLARPRSSAPVDPARSFENERLHQVSASYGPHIGAFDAAMRGYMMRTFETSFQEGPCLQVGSAQGDQTALLAERFSDLTVVEPVDTFIKQAAARVPPRVTFVQTLIEDFQTNRRFSTIMLSHVLEHLDKPVAILKRLKALLTPAGLIYTVVPNAEAPSRRIAAKMGRISHLEGLSDADHAAGHRRVYTSQKLCADVSAAGLVSQQVGGIFYKPLANFQLDALIGGPLIGNDFMEACYQLGFEHPCSCASIYVVAGRPSRLLAPKE